jgi:8-oxo-dGTP pyrophosphatase MutT (NUDIX family)
MVEPGEEPLEAAKREFIEEVIGIDDINSIKSPLKEDLQKVFDTHKVVDKCYGKYSIYNN